MWVCQKFITIAARKQGGNGGRPSAGGQRELERHPPCPRILCRAALVRQVGGVYTPPGQQAEEWREASGHTCGAGPHEGQHRGQAATRGDEDVGLRHELDLQVASTGQSKSRALHRLWSNQPAAGGECIPSLQAPLRPSGQAGRETSTWRWALGLRLGEPYLAGGAGSCPRAL